MADSSYNLEIKLASKNGYFTPAEARNYYGRYSRDGYCVHWWGDGTGASNHDNIVNYMLAQAEQGTKSPNYVLSDNKITMMVNPDNVAWCQESGNATEVSVETQPTLGDEGYKKHGWLKDQLEQRYGKRLAIHGHNFWWQTTCPGIISLDRIEQETDKWRRGVYDQPAVQPPVITPAPTPAPVEPVFSVYIGTKYTLANAKLVNIKDMSVVKTYPLDTAMDIGAKATYNGKEFYLTEYAFQHKTGQGFLVGDLKDAITPPVVVPEQPEWIKNLRDIDDTEYWFKQDAPLVDITTGQPIAAKMFKKDDSFVSSALTVVNNVEYRITDYSFKKKLFNGVPTDYLTLTAPGIPNIPPVVSLEDRVGALEKLVAAIRTALAKLGITI